MQAVGLVAWLLGCLVAWLSAIEDTRRDGPRLSGGAQGRAGHVPRIPHLLPPPPRTATQPAQTRLSLPQLLFALHLSAPISTPSKMGQTSSTASPTTLPEFALHCLRVADHSPADGLLEPFFDYLIGVDAAASVPTGAASAVAVPTPAELARVLEENEGIPIRLTVYNAKTQRVRGELLLC